MKTNEGAEGQNGAFQGQNAPRGRGAVPLIGECTLAAPPDPDKGQCEKDRFKAPHEAIPGQTRILLSEAASRHLLSQGDAFALVSRSWHPDIPGRMVIHLAPVPLKVAQDAASVLCGTSRAVRIKAKLETTKAATA